MGHLSLSALSAVLTASCLVAAAASGTEFDRHVENALKRDGEPEYCIRELSKAIALEPDRPSTYMLRAAHRTELEQYSAAIEDLTRAIDLEGDAASADLYQLRAAIHIELSDVDLAMVDLDRALVLDAASVPALMLKVQLLQRNGKHREGLKDLAVALVRKPESIDFLYLYGDLSLKLGDIATAVIVFRRASRMMSEGREPSWKEFCHTSDTKLAIIFSGYWGYESYRDATASLKHAKLARARAKEKDYYVWKTLSLGYYVNRDFDRSLNCLSTAIALAPNDKVRALELEYERIQDFRSSGNGKAELEFETPLTATDYELGLERVPDIR